METKTVLKFLPWVATAILTGLLLLAYGTIDNQRAKIDGMGEAMAFQSSVITAQAQGIDTRDKIIKQQSKSIDDLAQAAEVDRKTYEAGLKAAGKIADDHRSAAAQLLALSTPEGELAQCRAARSLLETELLK